MEDCPLQPALDNFNGVIDTNQAKLDTAQLAEHITAFSGVAELGRCSLAGCDGLIMDRRDGRLFCGRRVPEEVTRSNARILTGFSN